MAIHLDPSPRKDQLFILSLPDLTGLLFKTVGVKKNRAHYSEPLEKRGRKKKGLEASIPAPVSIIASPAASLSLFSIPPPACHVTTDLLRTHHSLPGSLAQEMPSSTCHTGAWPCRKRLGKVRGGEQALVTHKLPQKSATENQKHTGGQGMLRGEPQVTRANRPLTTSETLQWGSMLPMCLGWAGLVLPSKIRAVGGKTEMKTEVHDTI